MLVIFLGGVENVEGKQLGDDGTGPEMRLAHFAEDSFGLGLLGSVGVKNGGTVLTADIRALTVEGGGVVYGEKDVQQVRVGDHSRVEGDADALGMAGQAGADLLIGRRGTMSAGIAGDDGADAAHLLEDGFKTPETSTGENGRLQEGGGGSFHASILHRIG